MTENARFQRFNLRVPRDLLTRLEGAAAENSHSTNAEIIKRLQLSFCESVETNSDQVLEAASAQLSKEVHNLAEQNKATRQLLIYFASEKIASEAKRPLLIGKTMQLWLEKFHNLSDADFTAAVENNLNARNSAGSDEKNK